ncbi:MAG: asparagine synthase (glutamine-hydrolyzing) [Elusimicrobia bacterium CG06_land_8_20_14_3_00_38_11]|nr:MAG: asparagine synthase (glutamine-hydrolyzing) [Elusimicrobia bacterium CG06_land_8_20_14_3_00_38_11]
MCGIFGIINFEKRNLVEKNEIKIPLDLMSHRGPDDEGIFLDDYAGLGIRRLKIIDIAGGHQPISNETDDIIIVYNGEIYNYIELREDLIKKGHRFKTKTDTEVILHLYEDLGVNCLEKLNGMFAFAIWDKRKKELFAARDRLGIKPLFYSVTDGSLYFSSEIKSILSCKNISKEMDILAMVNYFSFYYISAPWTIYKNIKRLQPGHYLFLKNGNIEINRYWKFSFKEEKIDEIECIGEIKRTLLNSVKRHLQSEVPLGVFLSSGLDSTSIVAMMGKLGQATKTYTVGYENGKTYNEIDEAKIVAKKYNTIHSDCILKPKQVEEILPEVIKHLAEPHGDWTQVALYYLSQQSKKDITVVLSGAGGDELFAGYPTLTAAKIANFYNKLPKAVKNFVKHTVNKLPTCYDRLSFDFKSKSFIKGSDMMPEMAHLKYKEIFSDDERQKLLYNIAGQDPFDVYKQHLENVEGEKLLNRLLYLDLNVFLPDCVLQVTDMTTMMNSQECRVPFLDLEMLNLSEKIPVNLKLRGLTTKYILRKALKEFLPVQIAKLPKKGLAMPTPFWLQNELKNFTDEIISDAESRNRGMFNFNYIKQIQKEHTEGKKDNTRKITCLISFFLWQKFYQ